MTPKDEALANLRLIVGAPEMLNALKVLRLSGPLWDIIRISDMKAAEQVEAAIAKAEGRS